MAICKFCGGPEKLIKAHIIPEAFYQIRNQSSEERLRLYSNKEGSFPKKAPIGVYDQTILCATCEARFSDWDTYGARILLKEEDRLEAVCDLTDPTGQPIGLSLADYDYGRLKLFFLSVFWRAAVSSHLFYQKVKGLGPYEAKLLSMLKDANPGRPDEFAISMSIYADDHSVARAVSDPVVMRLDDVRVYRFKIGRYVVLIKADKKRLPEPFREFQLQPDKPLIGFYSSFINSRDHKVAMKVASANPRVP